MVSTALLAQPARITPGSTPVQCQILPTTPLSKSKLTNYTTSKISTPHMKPQTSTALNWSGYASFSNGSTAEIGSVTGVWGNWTVPHLHASINDRFSGCWVGIDGYSNQTVEQIGTAQEWIGGRQVNFVWFSIFPGPTYELAGFPIQPNDHFRASVSYVGNDVFEMTIENLTQGVYALVPTNFTTLPGTERNSAEWIVEAPFSDANGILPLAHFSPVPFRECLAAIRGSSHKINSTHWQHSRITMVTGTSKKGVLKAVPSPLFNDGKNFIVKWHHS
jgi:hypothetical protein